MAQINRLPLSKELQNQMYELFYNVLADLSSDKDIQLLLNDLLTPTEKVMIAKRLAIAFLLEKGYDQRTIHTMMKVSVTTVNTVNFWLTNKGDGYRKAIRMIRKEQKWMKFVQKLDIILYELFSEHAMRKRIYTVKELKKTTKSAF